MFDALQEWIASQIPGYEMASGQWVDSPEVAESYFATLSALGGAMPSVGVRNDRFGLILLGRRNERGDWSTLMDDANLLVSATLDDTPGRYLPCGAANVAVSRLPAGPNYTTENRPYVSLDFMVTW